MIDFFEKILKVSKKHWKKSAIVIEGQAYSYQELMSYAFFLSQKFIKYRKEKSACIIISEKKIQFYAGMLACFFSNMTYLPINVKSPIEKNIFILHTINSGLLFIGEMEFDALISLLSSVSGFNIVFSNKLLYEKSSDKIKLNSLFYLGDVYPNNFCFDEGIYRDYQPNRLSNSAYVLFTSGSTGFSKGVPISFKNLTQYISAIFFHFSFSKNDRFLQLSDIAFDISIHEILVCFSVGATLYVYNEKNTLNVSQFIFNHKITHCILVPSDVSNLIDQCHFFKYQLSSLKSTFVCGEPFPTIFAKKLALIAPNSIIANLYGPTEATVACTYHIFNKQHDYGKLLTLPIGQPLLNCHLFLTEKKELVIVSDQVSNGYFSSDFKKSTQFQYNANFNQMSFYTNDHVTYDKNYGYLFHGRFDDQWQIKGYRIEKSEIESVLRHIFNHYDCCVVPNYDENQLIKSITAFSTVKIDILKYKNKLLQFLPEPAIPLDVIKLDKIPKLANGKTNYRNLINQVLQ